MVKEGVIHVGRMRRAVQVVLLLIVLLHVGGPMFETVDEWDNFPQSGNDYVLSLLTVVLCLGLMLVNRFWPAVLAVLSLFWSLFHISSSQHRRIDSSVWTPVQIPKNGPLILRI